MSMSGRLYLIPLRRFSNDEFPCLAAKLEEHQSSIEKLKASCNWSEVQGKLARFSATINALKTAINELKNVSATLDAKYSVEFERECQPVVAKATDCLQRHLEYYERSRATVDGALNTALDESVTPASHHSDAGAGIQLQLASSAVQAEEQLLVERQQQLHMHRQLHTDIQDVHELMCEVAALTKGQSERVGLIETQVETAQLNVSQGVGFLARASQLAGSAVAPATGALIGGLVAGPIGLLAGAKVGGAAAVGGGVLGYVGGRVVNIVRGGMTRATSLPAGCHAASDNSAAWWRKSKQCRRLSEEPVDAVLCDEVEQAEEMYQRRNQSVTDTCLS